MEWNASNTWCVMKLVITYMAGSTDTCVYLLKGDFATHLRQTNCSFPFTHYPILGNFC